MNIIDTSFTVNYDMLDITAEKDSRYHSDNKRLCDISKLSAGTDYEGFGTCIEHNFFVMDGSMKEFPDKPDIAYMSYSLSEFKEGPNIPNNPKIVITFTAQHSSTGLTLYFADTHPKTCKIYYYTLDNTLLNAKEFTITSNIQKIFYPVQNYGKIIIEFLSIVPNRFVKLNKIEYGLNITWDESNISSGSLVEEMDSISDKIAINSLTFSVIDIAHELDLGDSEGLHKYIQKRQILRPYEYIRGKKQLLGNYFVDKFSQTGKEIKFNCVDYIGLMEGVTYYTGKVWTQEKAGVIIDDIMKTAGITSYTVDRVTYNQTVTGTIKPMTCRKALREVLFACQSVVDDSRRDNLEIFKRPFSIKDYLARKVKISTVVSKRDYISGITVKYNEYHLDTAYTKVVSGTYFKGDNLITFNSPFSELKSDVGTIKKQSNYYCILTMANAGEATISGKKYTTESMSYTRSVRYIEGGETPTEKSFSTTLADSKTVGNIAQSILNYYQNRLEIKTQFLANDQNVRDWCVIQNPDKEFKDFIAQFENIVTDLTGGFVSTGKLIGYYNDQDDFLFTGTEIYANDNTII